MVQDDVESIEARALDAERAGRTEEVVQLRTRAIQAARESGRTRVAAALCNRLGRSLERANAVQEAVIAYESGLRALDADPRLNVHADIERLGLSAKGFGAPRGTSLSDLYSEDLDEVLETAAADPLLVVKVLSNTGNAYARQPQDEPALEAYERALGRPEAVPSATRGRVLANKGNVLRRNGKLDDAVRVLDEARRLLEKYADQLEQRRVLTLMAGIEKDQGKTDAAEKTYEWALALYARADDPSGEGRAQAAYGQLLLEKKKLAAARNAFEAAVSRGRDVSDDELLQHAYWGLGMSLRAAGDADAAIVALREAANRIHRWRSGLATDEGKVAFTEGAQEVMDALIACHLDRATRAPAAWGDALQVVEEARGRALEDLMSYASQARQAEGDTGPVRCRSGGRQPGNGEIAPGVPAAASIVLEEPSFASMVAQMAPGARSGRQGSPGVPSPPDGPAPPPMARLVFHVLEDRTAVFAVSAEGAVTGRVAPLGREELRRRVEELRRRLDLDAPKRGVTFAGFSGAAAATAAAEDLLLELSRALIDAVATGLPDAGTPLAIEPHDALWLVPFAALRAPGGARLIERWPLVQAPSQATLEAARRQAIPAGPADPEALVVGNPMVRQVVLPLAGGALVFDPLPGAEREARRIDELMGERPRRLLIREAAGLEAVIGLTREPRIIHLATHAVAYGDDPLGSFVLLGESSCGQLLTAREVTALPLHADLVVLSACQTALGRITGDGVLGLARSFLVAGARSVVVSQWSVSDDATMELMTEFYRAYLNEGQSKARSLRQAMLNMMKRPGFEHPSLWAPFVLVGSEL